MTRAQPPAASADVAPQVRDSCGPSLRRSWPRTRCAAARGPATPCRPTRPARASTRPRAARRGASGPSLASARRRRSGRRRSAPARPGSPRGPGGRGRCGRPCRRPETVAAITAAPSPWRATTRSDPLGGASHVRWRLMSACGPRLEPSGARSPVARSSVVTSASTRSAPRRTSTISRGRAGVRRTAVLRAYRSVTSSAGTRADSAQTIGEEGPRGTVGDRIDRVPTAPLIALAASPTNQAWSRPLSSGSAAPTKCQPSSQTSTQV